MKEYWDEITDKRNRKLIDCDWTQLLIANYLIAKKQNGQLIDKHSEIYQIL